VIALDHVSVLSVPEGFVVEGHRAMLDRGYIEVGHEGDPLVFLRPDDIAAAARLLGREPRRYAGRDGEWLDVELAGPVALTRRIAPADLARDWPPARPGAPALDVVRLRGDAASLLDPLEALGGPPPGLLVDHAPGEPLRVTQVIAGGVRVL
jgi:hypothetical protein